MIAFEIPGHPIAFARARVNAGGIRFNPASQVSFANSVRWKAAECMRGRLPLEGALRMTIRATFVAPASWPQKRRDAALWKSSKPDIDNLAKIVADALNKIVFDDDAQIAELVAQKVYGIREHVTVEVSEL